MSDIFNSAMKWIIIILFFAFFFAYGGLNWWVYANINSNVNENNNYKKAKDIVMSYAIIMLIFIVGMASVVYFDFVQKFLVGSISSIIMYVIFFLFLLTADIIAWYTFDRLRKIVKGVATEDDLNLIKELTLSSAAIVTAIFGLIILFYTINLGIKKSKEKKKGKTDTADKDSISEFMKSSAQGFVQ